MEDIFDIDRSYFPELKAAGEKAGISVTPEDAVMSPDDGLVTVNVSGPTVGVTVLRNRYASTLQRPRE